MKPQITTSAAARAGFTLIELVMTVAVLAILIAIAAPSVRDLMMNTRLTSQTNDLLTDLAAARSEAVKREVQVGICTSDTGTSCTTTAWDLGWIVFIDADKNGQPDSGTLPIRRMVAFDGKNTLVRTDNPGPGNSTNVIAYSPTGRAAGVSAGGAVFQLRDPRTCGRNITVALIGRASTVKVTSSSCS